MQSYRGRPIRNYDRCSDDDPHLRAFTDKQDETSDTTNKSVVTVIKF